MKESGDNREASCKASVDWQRFRQKKGSVSVFLTMALLSMLLLTGMFIEAASGKAAKSYGDAVIDLAGRSVLSEYDLGLKERYGMFGLKGEPKRVEERLKMYAEASFEKKKHDLFRLRLERADVDFKGRSLLDLNLFEHQILEYMKYRIFLDSDADVTTGLRDAAAAIEDAETEGQEAEKIDMDREEKGTADQSRSVENTGYRGGFDRRARWLQSAALEEGSLQSEVGEVPGEEGEETAEERAQRELKELVEKRKQQAEDQAVGSADGIEENRVLRNQKIKRSLPSYERTDAFFDLPNLKDLDFSEIAKTGRDNYYVNTYIQTHFLRHGDLKTQRYSFFQNEVEYILWGTADDQKNYRRTKLTLMGIRSGINLAHVYADPEKRAETAALAMSVAPGPGAAAVQFIIAAGWAAAEAGNDIRRLEQGGRVPLMKTKTDWVLSLQGFLSGESRWNVPVRIGGQENEDGVEEGEGYSYEDYLGLLLLIENREVKLLRVMDLIQLNLQGTYDRDFRIADHFAGFTYSVTLSKRSGYLPVNVFDLRKTELKGVHMY